MNSHHVTKQSPTLIGLIMLVSGVAAGQPPDVSWTFGNVDVLSYRLDAVTPSDAESPPLGAENPTLPLELGNRYEVVVTNYTFHPFEVLAKGASVSNDSVLLSMAAQGAFESDPDVAWEDDGAGTVRFTLTAVLYQAMIEAGRGPGYRCQTHPTTMRGDFSVTGSPIAERIGPSSIQVNLQPVASGLTAPVVLVPDPVQSGRLYVVDQVGWIRVIDRGRLLDEPFLDVTTLLVDVRENYDERGFLGLAFHPGYGDPESPGHGQFFTYTSEPVDGPADFTLDLPAGEAMNHQSVIRQWDATVEPIDPTSSREVLRIDQPQGNHNGGHIEFGPDGYLYIALGDGGAADDRGAGHGDTGNGQNINTIHGSIVRIDPLDPAQTPDSPDPAGDNDAYRRPADNPFVNADGVDEIFAFGFRNPYRFSFDRLSGALIVADVGQNNIEEVDFVRNGLNYGWNTKEGTFAFDPATGDVGDPLDDPALIDPVVEYDHDDGIAVVGGYVYYGAEASSLWGRYLFGDFSTGFSTPAGRLFVADLFTGQIEELLIGRTGRPLGQFVKGFGQGGDGEVYVLTSMAGGPSGQTGAVMKIGTVPSNIVAIATGATAGTDSAATGLAVLTPGPDPGTLSYELKVQGIENIIQAHIHIADEGGGIGPVAIWLYPPEPPAVPIPGPFTGLLNAGQFTATDFVGPLEGMTLQDLMVAIEENRAYVNIHTDQFPGGEIRGHLK